MQLQSHKTNMTPRSESSRQEAPVASTVREAELLAELRATQEFLAKVLTSLNDHYVIFDNEWRYIYANDAAARTLGVSKEKLIGSVIWELFPQAVGNQFYQELHRVRNERKDFVSEHYYQAWDIWFENRYYVLPDGVAVLSIDITARKRAEAAQRQSEELLAFALKSANMVAWEWDLERDLVKFSRSDNHIYGMVSSYSTAESYQTVYVEDQEAHRQKVMHCVESGEPYHSSYRIHRPDSGELNWVDEWGFALRDSDGMVNKLFGVAMESTERKETEERLQVIYQLSEAVNRAEAVEQIYDLALSGLERVLHVHRASILLFDEKGVMRIQAWRDLSEQYRTFIDGQLPRFINEANPVPVLISDVAHANLSGQEQIHLDEGIHAIAFIPLIEHQKLIGKFMLYYDEPHLFSDAEVQWAQTIARHVAHALERKQSELRMQSYARSLRELNATLEERVEKRTEELQRSNRELDQFAYVASHDLKAPLRAINHLATWIADDAGELLPATSKEHLSKLQGRVRRMETLLDDMLAYSRAGRQRHPPEDVDIAEMVQNVVDVVVPPVGFVVEIKGTLPVMRVERSPLETVFRNLIGNAIKHHDKPNEGLIEISARPIDNDPAGFVEFMVRDNGPGIASEYHQRVFEMFQTLKPRDMVEGSGIGLAVVKRSVESRGGTIRVESEPGKGATFYFSWPKSVPAFDSKS
jgi:PAS domain S-box-containing protein